MRRIKTFILRLYIDPDLHEQICGDIRVLPGHKTFSFKSNSDLLTLLDSVVNKEFNDLPMSASKDEKDPE